MSNRTLELVLFFVRRHPARTALLVFFLVLSGLAEAVGIVSLLPMLEIALATGEAEPSTLSLIIKDALALVGLEPGLGLLLTLVVSGIILKAVLYLLAMKHVGETIADVTAELRLELIDALMNSRWAYFVDQPSGRFANTIGGEAVWAATAYRSAVAMVAAGVQAMIYTGIAVVVSWQIALAAVGSGALVVLVLNRLVAMARAAGSAQNNAINALLARLMDALQGIKPLKAMGREGHVRPLLEAETRGINLAQARMVLATEALKAAQEPIMVVMLAIALYLVLTFSSVPFATVLMMAFLFHRLAGRVSLLQIEYQSVAAGENAFFSLRGQIALSGENREQNKGARPAPSLVEDVTLDSVSFGYSDSLVLDRVTFTIPSGSFAVLVGPSGVGKTTVADLVAGLHQPDTGEIRIDGIPLGEVDLSSWRTKIGYVPQEMLLFHDTLLRNLTLGDDAITHEDIEWALRAAGAWEFVQSLPNGLQTVLGERGSRLSGGQRQRISIARALARRPRLLILDEITTSLDPASEAAICEALKALSGFVTILAITHQTALTSVADIVYRLEAGSVETISSSPAGIS